jgi:hypothetical protein
MAPGPVTSVTGPFSSTALDDRPRSIERARVLVRRTRLAIYADRQRASSSACFFAPGPPNARSKRRGSNRARDLVLFLWSMAQTIVPAQAQAGSFAMFKNNEAITGSSFAFSTRSMPPAWTLDVPEQGADCSFPVGEGIGRSGQASIPATVVGRMRGGNQRGSNDTFAFGDVSNRNDLNDPSLERYLRARNAPYSLGDLGNLLESNRNGAPSERTKDISL